MGGKCGTGAAAHDDAGHHDAHFTHHGDPDEIRHIETRSEVGELGLADECEDHADEKTDQHDDGESLRTALLDDHPEVARSES